MILLSFTDPFLVKRISDIDYRYEFFTTDKKIKPKKDKIYFWFKAGAVHYAQGGIAGELLHGKYTKSFHSNQLAEQGQFKNGLKEGTWKQWYPNGIVQATQYWSAGIKDGSYYQYGETGEVIIKGYFKNHKKHGKWINFLEKDTIVYKKGNIYVEKPKLSKEEKLRLKEANAKLKEEKKKAKEAQKALKKSEKEKKSDKKEIKKTPSDKLEKENFFKRLFGKKQSKQNINGQGT